jgi:hypothetical protein
MQEKIPRADAKLKSLPDDAQEALWSLLQRNGDQPGMSMEQVQAEVPLRHGFTVGMSALYEWRSWYGMRRRMESAKERAAQAKVEFLRENPDASADDLERVGQFVFTAEAMEGGNVKAYVALAKLRLAQKALDHDSRRIAILEKKARKLDELEAAAKTVRGRGGLSKETLEVLENDLKLL